MVNTKSHKPVSSVSNESRASMFDSMYYYVFPLLGILVVIGCLCAYNIHKRYSQRLNEPFECNESNKDPLTYDISDADLPGYNAYFSNVNEGSEPWKHHPINSIASDPRVTFETGYYYELDNATYTNALKKTLAVSCSFMADAITESNWEQEQTPALDTPSKDVQDAYDACIAFLSKKLNTSLYFELPGDIGHGAWATNPTKPTNPSIHSPIQVVHDVFTTYKIHANDPSMYLINMDAVLYRENKFHGKHVRIAYVAKKQKRSWLINVIAIEIVGIIPEDQIALFPVVAHDRSDVKQLDVTQDIDANTANTANANIKCEIVDNRVKCTVDTSVASTIKNHAQQYIKLADSKITLGY
jgi:hypothetical protein